MLGIQPNRILLTILATVRFLSNSLEWTLIRFDILKFPIFATFDPSIILRVENLASITY